MTSSVGLGFFVSETPIGTRHQTHDWTNSYGRNASSGNPLPPRRRQYVRSRPRAASTLSARRVPIALNAARVSARSWVEASMLLRVLTSRATPTVPVA